MAKAVVVFRSDVLQLFRADQNRLTVAQQNRTGLALEVAVTTWTGPGFVLPHLILLRLIGESPL